MTTYATLPEVISFVAGRLSKTLSTFTRSTSTTDGKAGLVPAPLAGDTIKCLTNDGQWTSLNTININHNAFTSWSTGVVYDVSGLFLFYGDQILQVLNPHTSTSVDADIRAGHLQVMAKPDLAGSAWTTGLVYTAGRVANYNGQLLQAVSTHVAGVFSDDCLAGRWKFIANTKVTTTVVGAGNYSFIGHVVFKDGLLWTCITPHVATSWIANNWLGLTRTFAGATTNTDGQSGVVPAPIAGQEKYVLAGSGLWSDLVTLLESVGYTPGSGGSSTGGTTVAGFDINTSSIIGPSTALLNSTHLRKITAVDTSGGGVTLTMPSTPTAGDYYSLQDANGSWATHNVTITNARFHGTIQTVTLDVSDTSVTLVWFDNVYGWIILTDPVSAIINSKVTDDGILVRGPVTKTTPTFGGANGTMNFGSKKRWLNWAGVAGTYFYRNSTMHMAELRFGTRTIDTPSNLSMSAISGDIETGGTYPLLFNPTLSSGTLSVLGGRVRHRSDGSLRVMQYADDALYTGVPQLRFISHALPNKVKLRTNMIVQFGDAETPWPAFLANGKNNSTFWSIKGSTGAETLALIVTSTAGGTLTISLTRKPSNAAAAYTAATVSSLAVATQISIQIDYTLDWLTMDEAGKARLSLSVNGSPLTLTDSNGDIEGYVSVDSPTIFTDVDQTYQMYNGIYRYDYTTKTPDDSAMIYWLHETRLMP